MIKMKIKYLILILFTIFLFGCGDNISKAKEENDNDYIESLQDVKSTLIITSINAENMLNLYSRMWSVSIKGSLFNPEVIEKETGVSREEIEDYFETESGYDGENFTDGNIKGEPQDVIRGLQDLYIENGQIDELNELLVDVKDEVQNLNNPPEEYEKVFDKLLEMYSSTEEMADLAISPSGSLVSFNQKINELGENVVKLNKEIEVLLPADEEE